MSLLEVADLHAAYGEAQALHGLTFDVADGEVVVLLGRNGMGKTSTMRAIVGWPQPNVSAGTVHLDGELLTGIDSFRIAQAGIGYVPQGRRIFGSLTVEENLRVVARAGAGGSTWDIAAVFELFPRLLERRALTAGFLSGGEQQMLAVGRALVTNPRVLLLDEPSEGLAPAIVKDIGATVKRLRGDMTVVIAEQDIRFALDLADRVFVLDRGAVAVSGTPQEIDSDAALKRRLLGVG